MRGWLDGGGVFGRSEIIVLNNNNSVMRHMIII